MKTFLLKDAFGILTMTEEVYSAAFRVGALDQ